MDVEKILAELRQERDQIDEAILSVERLARSRGGPRRGRPPAWMTETRAKRRGRPLGSTRKAKPKSGGTPTGT
jgi:hypothetical protein